MLFQESASLCVIIGEKEAREDQFWLYWCHMAKEEVKSYPGKVVCLLALFCVILLMQLKVASLLNAARALFYSPACECQDAYQLPLWAIFLCSDKLFNWSPRTILVEDSFQIFQIETIIVPIWCGQATEALKGAQPVMHAPAVDVFQRLAGDLDTEGRYLFLNALANQLRFPNSHTHYFSCVLLFLFSEAQQVRCLLCGSVIPDSEWKVGYRTASD